MAPPIFPTLKGLTLPSKRSGPIFDTAKEDSVSGRSARYARRVNPKWSWELSFDAIPFNFPGAVPSAMQADFSVLAGFFAQLYGGALPFYYLDPDDNAVVTPQNFGTGDGTTTAFQLVRVIGGFTEKVVYVTGQTVYVNGVAKTAGTDYTIGTTGIVTFAAAPAAGAALTWKGTFYFLCEMDDDKIDFDRIMTGMYQASKLAFTSKLV